MSEETESTDSGSNRLAWFLAGAAIGTAAGLLYSPRSGKDTRQLLTEKSRETLGDTGKVIEGGRELFERGKKLVDDIADLFEQGRKLVQG